MSVAKPGRNLLASAVLAALATTFLAAPAPALAQEEPPEPAAGRGQQEQEPVTLSTITVTAQKREEALQDVPISVTALGEQALQDAGVRDVKDLQVLVPGLTVTSTQSEAQTTARIRGIGTVGDNAGLESSVGVVIDGVYRPRNGVGFGDLGEIERIEVLKGPQGTVFGKNTSAGVINVLTRRPHFETEVEGELTVGNYGAVGVAGSFNSPINDDTAFRLYAAKRHRDGFMDVRTGQGPRTETEDYDQNFHTLRGQLLFAPTDSSMEVRIIGDFSRREENCCTAVQTTIGATSQIINLLTGGQGLPIAGPPFPAAGDPFARVAYSNRSTAQDITDKGVSIQADWDVGLFGDAAFTSITAFREWEAVNGLDFDFTTADILYRNPRADESLTAFETFSQELRLTGASERLDWMFGLFYSSESLARNETYQIGRHYEPYLSIALLSLINPALANPAARPQNFLSEATGLPPGTVFAGFGADDRHNQRAKSLALFTNNTWHATDALDLTLGLRYTIEDKDLSSRYSNPNGSPGCSRLLGPGGQQRLAAALLARGVPPQALPQVIPQVIGFSCLPWANPLHNGRVTRQEREEKEWSGTLKAAYRFNESIMGYASAARGYKAGGFNLDRVQSANGLSSAGQGIVPVNDTSFPGEFVDSFELGAKTTWLGGNLLLNATAFHQTYEDFQLNSFLGTSFVVRSIPEVVSQGIDTEFMWQPAAVPGLMLQGGLMYADTRYGDSIPGGDFVEPTGALYKLPGSRVSFAPYWSGSMAATYEWDVGNNLLARFNVSGKYMSDYNTGSDLDVEKEQKGFSVVNARVGFGARDRSWELELWGLNIFDEEYIQVGFDGSLQNVSPVPGNPFNTFNAFLGAPATYGVTFRVRY
ncbi:MAG: TonB-dependent receptor [Gammaproteobacteria bacterium]